MTNSDLTLQTSDSEREHEQERCLRLKEMKSPGRLGFNSLALSITVFGILLNELAIAGAPAVPSLKGKTDDELLRLVIGGRNDQQKKTDEEFGEDFIRFSSLDRLWEMSPPEAALVLASQYVGNDAKGRVKFAINESAKARPPGSGEIGIRWISGNYYALPERGVTVLRYDGTHSCISISDVQILGPVSKEELDEALSKLDNHPIPAAVAQRTYEILWWLHRVHRVGDRVGGTSIASTDDVCDAFWMKPDGPVLGRDLLGTPNGEDLDDEQFSSFPAFAYTVIRRVIEREGIKSRRPLPTIGHHVDPNPDAEFLRLHPQPDSDDAKTVKQWVQRMAAILRNPQRYEMHNDVLYALVPIEDPLRYKDSQIDRALLDILRHADSAAAIHEKAANEAEQQEHKILDDFSQPRTREDEEKRRALSDKVISEHSAATSTYMVRDHAGEALGFRDCVSAFPELMERAKRPVPNDSRGLSGNDCLTGAASLAGNHPKLRPRLIDYLRPQLADIRKSQDSPQQLFDVVWRADLRELTPALEKVATNSPDENEDPSISTSPAPTGGNGKFHAARVILMAWREPDPLTKTKLDAMINGYVGGGNSIPRVLRAEFNALTPNDQAAFRNFITSLRSVEVPWSRKLLEDVFTPHTPRPDIPFER